MITPLAIFTPILGWPGHHFLKAHIEEILPGGTAVFAMCALGPGPPAWGVTCPTLVVEPLIDFREFTFNQTEMVRHSVPPRHAASFAGADHTARVRRFIKDGGVKVILAQWLDDGLALVELAEDLGVPLYTQAHGTDIRAGLTSEAVRSAYARYNRTAGIIAPSEFGRRKLLSIGLRPDKVHAIYHGVAVPACPPVKRPGPVTCLAVGRLAPMKGPLVLLDAFRQAVRVVPDLHLHHAGDGPLRSEVETFIDTHGLRGRVTLHGFLPHEQMIDLMAASDLFVHPSLDAGDNRFDTCPVAVVEAMANAVPVIATRHGGIPEEVTHGTTGVLVGEGDAGALAEAILTLARDRERRLRLGTEAWAVARDRFSYDVMSARMRELLGV